VRCGDLQATSAAPKGFDLVGIPGWIALNHDAVFENHGERTKHLPQKYFDSGVSGEEGLVTSMFRLACNPATLRHPRMEQ
jgi:hypothetical protein